MKVKSHNLLFLLVALACAGCETPANPSGRALVAGVLTFDGRPHECRYAHFILSGCDDYRKPDPVLIALIVLEESGLRRERDKAAADRAAR